MASHGGNEMRGCQNQSGTSNSLGAKLNHIGSIVPRDSQFRKKCLFLFNKGLVVVLLPFILAMLPYYIIARLYYCHFWGGKKRINSENCPSLSSYPLLSCVLSHVSQGELLVVWVQASNHIPNFDAITSPIGINCTDQML